MATLVLIHPKNVGTRGANYILNILMKYLNKHLFVAARYAAIS